jgi:hypothetical protein
MEQNTAILTHEPESHQYILSTEDYSLKSGPVSMVSPFIYNGSNQEEVYRIAKNFSLARAKFLGAKLEEKVSQ